MKYVDHAPSQNKIGYLARIDPYAKSGSESANNVYVRVNAPTDPPVIFQLPGTSVFSAFPVDIHSLQELPAGNTLFFRCIHAVFTPCSLLDKFAFL